MTPDDPVAKSEGQIVGAEHVALARRGRDLRNKRHQPSPQMTVKPKRLLVGTGIGLLALVGGIAAFVGIQQFRLRRCMPLLESRDPATKKLGVGRALALPVYLRDRTATRAIILALPSLSFRDREWILSRLSYWEGRDLRREDAEIIAQSLTSPNDMEIARAARLLEIMGPDAVSALPALEGALKVHSTSRSVAYEPVTRAIASVRGTPLPDEGVPATEGSGK